MEIDSFLEQYRWQVMVLLLGLLCLGLGILGAEFWQEKEEGIEILSPQENKEIIVDLEGAVAHPGVYKLSLGSRINDLLIKAGGLSAEADRNWVEKNLNLAQKLEDGIKIYIPQKNESGQVAGGKVGKINLNTASQSELETLSGIGPSFAKKIIENRPYQKIEDLLKVSGIGVKKFEQIKDQVTVF